MPRKVKIQGIIPGYKVDSSMITVVGYHRGVLWVIFNNNAVYRYFGVPELTYIEMVTASSIGKYFNANVKAKNYKYMKQGTWKYYKEKQ